jgi:hypothetical protein
MGPGGNMWGEEAAEFAGFTTLSYTGAQGGRQNMNEICATEFGDAHLCHVSEYYLSNSATPYPAGGAWLDPSVSEVGGGNGYSIIVNVSSSLLGIYGGSSTTFACSGWTTAASGTNGTVVGGSSTTMPCSVARPLACCSSPYIESFAGYTAFTTNGAMAGRPNAHFMCASEFPSSHLCHAGEYWRSHPIEDPPAAGAWLDPSGAVSTQAGSFSDAPSWLLGTATAGRYLTPISTWNCRAWTSAANGETGVFVGPGTVGNGACMSVRALACCY